MIRILIVARYKDKGFVPFVTEQVSALERAGVECRYFPVRSKGITGYLRHLPSLRKAIDEFRPDVVHAHYGLCGLLSNLQRKVPVVTTYHGSDINDPKVRRLSKIAIRLSRYNVFVSQKNLDLASPRKDYALVPCGINLEDYPIIGKSRAREQMGLPLGKKYVLFAGAFDNTVKNAPLAKAAVGLLGDVELMELKGYSRKQVAALMQAADAFLMTSFSEGSPQVIKEALACGCPIVSVDVGDVRERLEGVDGCFVVNSDVSAVSKALEKAVIFDSRTNGREAICRDGLTAGQVADKLLKIYRTISGQI
jgi:glycosyltransferase involved in cell wall biosynthesis